MCTVITKVVLNYRSAGQVGYLIASIKNTGDVLIGDTFCLADKPTEALPGFRPAKPMVSSI